MTKTTMTEFNLIMQKDGDMELLSNEPINFDGLLADEVVMDWLLKLEAEDAAADTLEEDQIRRARLAD